jgi:hypothetical protein
MPENIGEDRVICMKNGLLRLRTAARQYIIPDCPGS